MLLKRSDQAQPSEKNLARAQTRKSSTGKGTSFASYAYAGAMRRVAMTLGNGVNQSFAGGTGYTGLDRFGRVKHLDFKNSSGTSIHQFQYTYDLAGNRTSARLRRGGAYQGARSYYYAYDGLQRLVEAQKGPQLNANGVPQYSGHANGYTMWNLDILGNWTGSPDFGGRVELSGDFDILSDIQHEVNASNQIAALVQDGVSRTFVHDAAGNLVFDGEKVYHYDAWNRPVEIDEAGTLTAGDFNSAGQIAPTEGHAVGNLVMQMVYDGLGRLIEVRRPQSLPTITARPLMTVETYYYDGVRRLQQVVGSETDSGGQIQVPSWTKDRDYVYGTGYVDEFVA